MSELHWIDLITKETHITQHGDKPNEGDIVGLEIPVSEGPWRPSVVTNARIINVKSHYRIAKSWHEIQYTEI